MAENEPGVVLWISCDRDDQMGAKIRTQKNPWTKKLTPKKSHVEFPGLKNFQKP